MGYIFQYASIWIMKSLHTKSWDISSRRDNSRVPVEILWNIRFNGKYTISVDIVSWTGEESCQRSVSSKVLDDTSSDAKCVYLSLCLHLGDAKRFFGVGAIDSLGFGPLLEPKHVLREINRALCGPTKAPWKLTDYKLSKKTYSIHI
jgi:hypothetical protein